MKYGKPLFLVLALALFGTAYGQKALPLASDTIVPEGTVAIDSLGFDIDYAQMAAVDEQEASEESGVDPAAVIFGHIIDAHSWHLFDYYDKEGNEHAVAIPLPVILINDGHVDAFWSSKFHHGHAD